MRNRTAILPKPGDLVPWAFFLVAIALPPAFAIREAFRAPGAGRVGFEIERLMVLAGNSAALAALAMAIALPVGGWLGLVLERSNVRGRTAMKAMLLAMLFVPLPVQAVAWQVVFGSWLPTVALGPGAIAWRPWNEGLLPAAWVHGWAAVPWVAAIAMASLRYGDAAIEEQALMDGGPRAVLRRALAPRLALALAVAGGWIAAQTATEIAVTDTMQVRTFAEETYARIVGDPAGVGAAVAATVPVWLLAGSCSAAFVRRIERRFWPPESTLIARRELPLAGSSLAMPLVAAIVLVPLAALLVQAGSTASGWSFANLAGQLRQALIVSGGSLPANLFAAIVAGLATAWLAARVCWRLRDRAGLLVAIAVALAFAPAPIVGLGLKECIDSLLSIEDAVLRSVAWSPAFPPLRSLLYDQPSPLPAIWASTIRFFPVAVAVLLPVVRTIPVELMELARIEGSDPWRVIGRPMLREATGLAAVAVAALCLGEVGATKLVVPPQWSVMVLDLFNQMHYGTEAGVAALALIQAAATALVTVGLWFAITCRSAPAGSPPAVACPPPVAPAGRSSTSS
jgi:iron(III) transport system permease protein